MIGPTADVLTVPAGGNIVDAASVRAAALALGGNHHEAARVFGDALGSSDSGCAGCVVAVDPIVWPTARLDSWAEAVAFLARPTRYNLANADRNAVNRV